MSLGGIVFGYCAEPKERAGRCLHLNTNRLRVQTLYSLVVNLLSSLKKKKKKEAISLLRISQSVRARTAPSLFLIRPSRLSYTKTHQTDRIPPPVARTSAARVRVGVI